MNLKILALWPLAALNSVAEVVIFNGKSNGFSEWVADRKYGDPIGNLLKSRKETLKEQETGIKS